MEVDFTITSAKIETSNNYGGFRFWSLFCERVDGRFSRFNLSLHSMQNLGVAKNLSSTKKVTHWLNTPEGLKWINERVNNSSNTLLGIFL